MRTPITLPEASNQTAPQWWREPCSNEECTLHQLAPYIGKIKSRIAGDLIDRYTKRGDVIVDPFAGSGTIPLEAVLRGRIAVAADISSYAQVISTAKLSPPKTLEEALNGADEALVEASLLPRPDLRSVPRWVRNFFHPKTLQEAIRFANVARQPGREFLMACFLGILHHQRPGFLSYPSSHLVPYLRNKKFPPDLYPEMYAYRELRSRLRAKILRTYKRFQYPSPCRYSFTNTSVEQLEMPARFDALITSPPYMNALDYGRDNRLRLWFIDANFTEAADAAIAKRRKDFVNGIELLITKSKNRLKRKGHCIFVVGEEVHRSYSAHPSNVVTAIVKQIAPSLKLRTRITDDIPDLRRTRRECRGIKTEHFLIFQQS